MSFYGGRERTLENCEKMYITLLNRKQHLESLLSDAVNLNEKLSLKKETLHSELEALRPEVKLLKSNLDIQNGFYVAALEKASSLEKERNNCQLLLNEERDKASSKTEEYSADITALKSALLESERRGEMAEFYRQKAVKEGGRAYVAEERLEETGTKLASTLTELSESNAKIQEAEQTLGKREAVIKSATDFTRLICRKQCDEGPYSEMCGRSKCNVFYVMKALGAEQEKGNR